MTGVGPDASTELVAGDPHWPISKIVVSGLLGDHGQLEIDLERDLTVLTGENGSGKTTLLQAISAVAEGSWYDLSGLPLGAMILKFEDGYELTVDNHGDVPQIIGPATGESWSPPSKDSAEFERLAAEAAPASRALRAQWWARRNALAHNMDPSQLDSDEPARFDMELAMRVEGPQWLTDFERRFDCTFLTTRRLEQQVLRNRPSQMPPRPAIEEIPHALKSRINRCQLDYNSRDSEAGSVFTERAFAAIQAVSADDQAELEKEVRNLQTEYSNLNWELSEVGLRADSQVTVQDGPAKPEALVFLKELYSYRLSTMETLRDLKQDLEVFSAFLNDRLSGKTVHFNGDSGLLVLLDSADPDLIEPHQLSSGEKQLVVIAYGLLFETPRKSVVLLDEPELSLHVSWLRGFVDALLEIGARRELQFLLTTHSPSVTAGHSEKECSLDLLRAT